MFSGIIDRVGTVIKHEMTPKSQGSALWMNTSYDDLTLGESVAVSGVCLTVSEMTSLGEALFFISPETHAKTSLSQLKTGSRCNLERALSLQSRLSGHWVQGHVDGCGEIRSILQHQECHELLIKLPEPLLRYCVVKGSIAIEGISLTINSIQQTEGTLSLMIIPHTWNATALKTVQIGNAVNVEVDVMAKYVEKLCHPYKMHLNP